MPRRSLLWGLPAAGALLLLAGAVVAGVLLSSAGGRSAPLSAPPSLASADPSADAAGSPPMTGTTSAGSTPRRARGSDPPVTVKVSDRPVGKPIPSGFLGFSFESQAVRTYTGTDPRQINPVLVQLIRNLTPGQAPMLRIGGDSTDGSYAPAPSPSLP